MNPGSEKRRQLLAMALGSAALAGCTSLPSARTPTLARPRISPERVTRVLVGLRPYRSSGFVVRAESLGTKRLVHHYGHGGAGITLSWGTAQLAVDMGFAGARERYAVIGCGVIGLSTALLLQRRGAPVTIYAKALPPETTSNIAGGHWSPTSLYDHETPAFLGQFNQAIRISYRAFQGMAGARHGIAWHRNYIVNDSPQPFGPAQLAIREVFPEMALLGPGEHPFGDAHVQTYMTMMIEPYTYLRSLMDMFLLGGGRIEVRDFASREEIAALPEATIFNCTGLGAKALFGDDELMPVRGQLVVLVPQPDLDYNILSQGFYMFPRSDGVILGGTFERGNASLEPEEGTTARILEAGARIAARLA